MAVEADIGKEYTKATMAGSIRKQDHNATGESEPLLRSVRQVPEGIVRNVVNKSAEDVDALHRVKRDVVMMPKSPLSPVKLDRHDTLTAPLAVNMSQVTTHRSASRFSFYSSGYRKELRD